MRDIEENTARISKILKFLRTGVMRRRDLAVAVTILENFDVEPMELQDLIAKRNFWGLNRAENDQGLSTACRYEA